MSPSESDLRAALRDGEGDGVDPDDIIWNVRQARARRRSMLLSAAAAVVVVVGTVAGVTALVRGGGSPNGASGAAMQGNVPRGGNSAAGSLSPASTPPAHRPPASRSLLAGPATEFDVCAYSSAARALHPGVGSREPGIALGRSCASQGGSRLPPTTAVPVRVTGQPARQLVASFKSSSLTTSRPSGCPQVSSTGTTALRMDPITPTRQRLPAITANLAQLPCATTVTNGRTLLYGWRLPPSVAAQLNLQGNSSGVQRVSPPSHGESGSPVK